MSKDVLGVSVHDAQGVVADLLQKLGGQDGREWLNATKRLLRKEDPWLIPIEQSYVVAVDYTESIVEYLKKGRYDFVDSGIGKHNYPTEVNCREEECRHIENVEFRLVNFGRNIVSEEAERELKKQNYRPATIQELLAFGCTEPSLQRQFPIIALGSAIYRVNGEYQGVSMLGVNNMGRAALITSTRGNRWNAECRFLAVVLEDRSEDQCEMSK